MDTQTWQLILQAVGILVPLGLAFWVGWRSVTKKLSDLCRALAVVDLQLQTREKEHEKCETNVWKKLKEHSVTQKNFGERLAVAETQIEALGE
jgi:hypothetical protein